MRYLIALSYDVLHAFAIERDITHNICYCFNVCFLSLQWINTSSLEMAKHIGDVSLRQFWGQPRKKSCGQESVMWLRQVETIRLLLHLAIALSLIGLCLSDCPDEWVSHKDFCFRMTEDMSDTFNLAESLCRKLHPSAHLASIHSEDENAAAVIATRNITAWIGLQLVKERWRWSDRTYVDYTNWLDEKTPIGNDTGCVQLLMSKQWQGGISCKKKQAEDDGGGDTTQITTKVKLKNKRPKRDKYSSSKRNVRKNKRQKRDKYSSFKRNVRSADDAGDKQNKKHGGKGKGQPALCKLPHMETCGGPDWIRAGEFCYNFSSPGLVMSWTDAGSYCLQMDARFVAIFNSRQNDVLRRLSHLAGNSIWLGLIHTDDGFHRWADGAIMTFENFDKHDKYDPNRKCVYLEDETGLWQHDPCSKELNFVCMRPKLQLYDARTANNSRPRATVEIWRRIEEALVPARAPPKPTTTTTTTAKPTPQLHAEMREEVIEASEKITAGVITDSAKNRGARRSSRRTAGRLRRRIRRHTGHLT